MPAEPFTGEIAFFPYDFVPKGWEPCDGRLLPISLNAALFALLGTTYGGDGRVNFALPDMRARSPVGIGAVSGLTPTVLGQRGGVPSVTLSPEQMPKHSHLVSASKTSSTVTPAKLVPGKGVNINLGTAIKRYGALGSSPVNMSSAAVEPTGASAPIPTQSPCLGLQCCICTQGYSPPRE